MPAINGNASNEYLRNAVLTASQEQLQMMLFDGAIRFTRQAREAIERSDLSTSCEKLLRAQKIVLEMEKGLRPEVNPTLCAQMASLYQFIYQRLVEANMRRDLKALDEALAILEHQRETWQLLMQKLASARAGEEHSNEREPEPLAAQG